MPDFTNDPRNSTGYSVIYPDRMAEVEKRKKRLHDSKEFEEDKILNREEAAEFLNLSISTLDRLVKTNSVPYARVGNRVLFSKFRLQDWMQSKEVLPVDYSERCYRPELMASREEIEEISQKAKHMSELANTASMIIKKKEDKEYWWQTLNKKQRAEIEQLEKTIWRELEVLSREINEIEQKQIQRFKEKLGIKSEG